MSALDGLLACAGTWRGTNVLHDPNTGRPDESPSTMTVTPVLGQRFVRLAYDWAWAGTPHEGEILVGHQPKKALATVHWIDSMHNGRNVMYMDGETADGGDTLAVRGSWSPGEGPDWGWTMTITARAGERLHIAMTVVSPEGEEDPAVEMTYAADRPS